MLSLIVMFSCNTTKQGCTDSQACNFDPDANVDNDSCLFIVDCAGECGGSVQLDGCGECGGDGPEENFDCNGDCLLEVDCLGHCGGSLVVDICGECGGIQDDASQCVEYGYSLDTCSESIDTNVPVFYQKYFKCVDIKLSESGNYINLYYNGLAPYASWYYPNDNPNSISWYSQGQGYFLIPNSYITEQNYVISIPVDPIPRTDLVIDSDFVDGNVTQTGVTYEYPLGSVGVALNGVNLFNPCASPPDEIEDEAYSFDLYSGHPNGPSGIYHYHTTSKGPLEVLNHKMPEVVTSTNPGQAEIEIYGIMCDGTVILGCTELDGSIVDTSDWDAQNGHVHDLIDESGNIMLENRYHTHICYDSVTDQDTDGNGYEEHEFTPEISYYKTPGMGQSFDRCAAMSNPIEPDME